MLSALLLLVAAPTGVAQSISGYSVEGRKVDQFCAFDAQSGYYLCKTVDCDWTSVSVTLTKDRRVVAERVYDIAPKPEALRLETNLGEAIGMTRAQLTQRRGTPTRTAVRGSHREFWCALYRKVRMTSKSEGAVWDNTYIFKNGRLIKPSPDAARSTRSASKAGRTATSSNLERSREGRTSKPATTESESAVGPRALPEGRVSSPP